ncbi:MAG: FAD-dependent oxidoreductase [Candidatus Hydrogenedentes bacterium]|nr:FAD-dependent oxidoreductase [Candidatus Hydrogenedentota bacterium]
MESRSCDVIVVGATPGGIGAAVAAARLGHSVALFEYYGHVGGMSASGLGKSDVETAGAIGGLWDEFVGRVLAYYTKTYGADSEQVKACRGGYFYEPSVAERIFNEMLAEQPKIHVFLRHRLDSAARSGKRVKSVRVTNRETGEQVEFSGKVFIDATYEGDLAAFAGAEYRLGRESRDEFDEAHAGVIYMDHTTRALLPGTTGLGDDRLVAYTYRLCFSSDPANRVYPEVPPDYDRKRYLNYLLDLRLGRIKSALLALSIAPIPNQKYDVNMKPWPLGFPFAEENTGYPEASWAEREAIMQRIRNITLGLVYFLQNDPEVPEADREAARQYGFAKDEFTDNGSFPFQFYVREARRVVGEYTISERDLTYAPESFRAPVHADSICAGEFPIDSFPTRKYESGHEDALEGYILMLNRYTRPYQIPYRAIVPKKVDGLLAPVPASATHIAFSSVRLEPTWMCMGQAAGVAAHLAIKQRVQPRHIPVQELQDILLSQGQVITYFDDLPKDHPDFAAFQRLGTRGFFDSYQANPEGSFRYSDADVWARRVLKLAGGDPSIMLPEEPGECLSNPDLMRMMRVICDELRIGDDEVDALLNLIPDSQGTATRRVACVVFDGVLRAKKN